MKSIKSIIVLSILYIVSLPLIAMETEFEFLEEKKEQLTLNFSDGSQLVLNKNIWEKIPNFQRAVKKLGSTEDLVLHLGNKISSFDNIKMLTDIISEVYTNAPILEKYPNFFTDIAYTPKDIPAQVRTIVNTYIANKARFREQAPEATKETLEYMRTQTKGITGGLVSGWIDWYAKKPQRDKLHRNLIKIAGELGVEWIPGEVISHKVEVSLSPQEASGYSIADLIALKSDVELKNFEASDQNGAILQLNNLNISSLAGLELLPDLLDTRADQVKKIDLSNNQIEQIPIGIFNKYRNIEIIDLSNNEIESIPSDVFEDIQSLKEVYLQNNKIKLIQESAFYGLINLEVLDLSNNNIDKLYDFTFIDLKKLQVLKLNGNKIKELPEDIFRNLSTLELLDISNNNIDNIKEYDFSSLPDSANVITNPQQ